MSRKSGYTSSLQENRVQGAREHPERAGIQARGARCGVGLISGGICIRGNDYYIKLLYLRSRWYSTDQGRFISRDTWQGDYKRPVTLNKWLYANASPVKFSDPSGLSSVLVDFTSDEGAPDWEENEKQNVSDAAWDVAAAYARAYNNESYWRASSDCPDYSKLLFDKIAPYNQYLRQN